MKKLLALTLTLIMALSMAACGKSDTPSSGATPINSTNGARSTVNDDSGDAENKALSFSSKMGKVTSIVGNEVEIDLVKEPEMPALDDSGVKMEGEGGMAVAMEIVPSVKAGEATGGGAKKRDDIELTGETKTFVIPAGMKIKDAMGNEKQLTDIKKGALLNVMLDEDDNISEVFLYE